MPGRIVSYDPTTMTATVQPSIQAMRKSIEGKIEPMDITAIRDVPVHFPGGGGHIMTFPVKEGDECMISFQERSIDNWHQHGGSQQPSDYRKHDINDAIVHVGLRSQPQVPAGVSNDAVQLRSDDGMTSISLNGKSGGVTVKTGGVVTIECSKLVVTGPIECKAEVTAKHGGPFVTLSQHIQAGQKPTPNT
jgi:hypothetical protein